MFFNTFSSFQLVSERVHLIWFHYQSVILDPLILDCNMSCVCENASMSVNPHNCDDMLLESLGVVDIPNIKLLKKRLRSLIRI